ncbi:hypothetical protein [Cellulomonas shaoxiangyii]|uniref:Uncharacterized protein n=1 Tax=Cellulomonas shaoxiangyii TaxID=2566013 RepID=A0A4P7SIH1_9CELL|nr:hypothetical protein [Cellulomonas shaoxiangyii]QCB93327.1 hypothetical protein E5225_06945 [Cellulomonas shaoxiangyii]TGY79432.1 hypothetical protein E5226_15475 [Cellulomonas shaoxiangyii]
MSDPTSPAAIARADERRFATQDDELDEPRETPCGAGWHERCDGRAWVPGPDVLVPCLCDCGCGEGAE